MNRMAQIITSSSVRAKHRIRLVDSMLEGMAPPRDGRAVEVGCGAGFSSAHLARRYGMKTAGADAAGEVARVVRPGGLFLFSDIRGPGTLMRSFSRLDKDHGFHATDELVAIMAGLGFEAGRRSEPEGSPHEEFAILFKKHPEAA